MRGQLFRGIRAMIGLDGGVRWVVVGDGMVECTDCDYGGGELPCCCAEEMLESYF